MTEYKIGSYTIKSAEAYKVLTEAKITSDKDLKRLDKNNDKIISEDDFVDTESLEEEVSGGKAEGASESSNSSSGTSGTSGTEDQILMLYEQLDKLEEQRRTLYNSLAASSDLDGYNSTLQEIENLGSQIDSVRNQIYQCYYNLETQSAAAVSGTGTTAAGTTSDGGSYTYSGDSAQFVNAFNNSSFNKGVLAGKGAMVASVAEKYGLDPNLLAAIMALETGWGTSSAIKNYNNPGGMMDPSSNWMSLQHYSSLEAGVEAVAKNLKKNYIDQGLTTISSIGAKYCPVGAANDPNGTNSGWVPSVTKIYNMLTGANITSGTKIG